MPKEEQRADVSKAKKDANDTPGEWENSEGFKLLEQNKKNFNFEK